MIFEHTELASPVGNLSIAASGGRLVALCFEGIWDERVRSLERRFPGSRFHTAKDPAGVVTRLSAYFGGDLDALTPIEVEMWGTPFRRACGTSYAAFLPVRRDRTVRLRARSVSPMRCARSERPTARTRSRSSCRATA